MNIGVTGGIGSGKSIVCKLFSCLGIPVYDADSRAKWLTSHDAGIRRAVINLLGPQSYSVNGEYNRSFVSAQVFNNPGLLKKLNGIIHPAVGTDTDAWTKLHDDAPYVIKEAAIMNRAGDHNNLDFVIVVKASMELRLKRIKNRDAHRSEDEIRAIIARQISDEERDAIADFSIDNNENAALIPQVLQLHRLFLEKSSR